MTPLEEMGEDLSKDYTCEVIITEVHFYKGKHLKTDTRTFSLKNGDSVTVDCAGIRCVP